MSAPTPPSRPLYAPVRPVEARTVRLTPLGTTGEAGQKLVLSARSPLRTAVELVARLGTAVTLAALLVVTATVLGVVGGEPAPTGATTTGP